MDHLVLTATTHHPRPTCADDIWKQKLKSASWLLAFAKDSKMSPTSPASIRSSIVWGLPA
jgi:hypothetical protein